MRITRQWNLSKHAAVVGTSGGAKMMLGLKWWRVHAILSNSESGCTGSYMPGIMPWLWLYPPILTIADLIPLFPRDLTVTSLIHIIDTPTFPVPPFRPSMRSKRTWLSFLERQPKPYIPCCQRETGISSWAMCPSRQGSPFAMAPAV